MAKLSKLPKVTSCNKGDLVTIIQGDNVRNITKKDLLGYLEDSLNSQSSELDIIRKNISRNTINKNSPSFIKPVQGAVGTAANHLTTKGYVDKELNSTIKDRSGTLIDNILSYKSSPKNFTESSLVDRKFVDDKLKGVLKNIKKLPSVTSLPLAKMGDCFISHSFSETLAGGPEIQEGDILICLEDSKGGSYNSVGHQFAIINTNVVASTEAIAGIVKIASLDDMEAYESDVKVITPLKYKQSLEASFMYNRTAIDRAAYIVVEENRGILAIDNRRSACTITLPSVTSLKNPSMFKVVVKDEFGQADLRNITIKASGATIDSKTQTILSNKYQAVTIYNDGKNYYVENNTHAPDEISEKVIQAGLVYPASTGAAETMYQADIDLSQFDIGQGFVVEVSGFFAANGNTKTVIIDIDGNTTVTNATTTAPNSDQFTARVTVIKEARYAIAYGYMLLEGIAADTYGTNSLNIDWNSVITAKVTANAATTNTDIHIYSMILEPLK